VLVTPSPNAHSYAVAPLLRLVKVTVSGAVPLRGVPENSAVTAEVTVM
jgi:hypothetical protein